MGWKLNKCVMSVEIAIKEFNAIVAKKNEIRESFIKQLLLMSTSLFGILVALHKTTANDNYSRISFSVALDLLLLGILCLSVGLYAQVIDYKNLQIQASENIDRQRHGLPSEIMCSNKSKRFLLVEKIGYIALLLAIVSLAIYAILIS